jgi:hypothetical protein
MKLIRNILFGLLVGVCLCNPLAIYAQDTQSPVANPSEDDPNVSAGGSQAVTSSGLPNPLGSSNGTIYDFVKAILGIFLKIGIFISAGAFIYSGFLFVKAQGSSTGREEASNAFFNTIIGTALLLGAWGLSQIIKVTIDSIVGN